MRLNEISYSGSKPVDGYGPGFFRVGGEVIEGAVLLTSDGPGPWGGWEDIDAVTALAGTVDVVFVGTGADIAHAPTAFQSAADAAGIGIEVMATPSACRTFNILLSEGRRIAAALLPV